MLVKQMHILFNQLFREMETDKKVGLSPQEIDLRLNVAQLTFVKSRLPKRTISTKLDDFEKSQASYDDIKEIKRSRILPVANDSTNYTATGELRSKTFLPPDYMHLVGSESVLRYNCAGYASTTITYNTSYYTVVPFYDYAPTGGHTHFDNIIIKIRDNVVPTYLTLFDITDAANPYYSMKATMHSVDAKFQIVDAVLEYVNGRNYTQATWTTTSGYHKFDAYWEYFDGQYYPNCFIFVTREDAACYTTTPPATSNFMSLITYDVAGTASTVFNAIVLRDLGSTGTSYTSYTKHNRLVSSTDINVLKDIPYHKTNYQSPLSIMEEDKLYVYYDTTFLPTAIKLTYLKHPRLVNIDAAISSEINSAFHEEIVKLAVASIQESINPSSYRNLLNEIAKTQ